MARQRVTSVPSITEEEEEEQQLNGAFDGLEQHEALARKPAKDPAAKIGALFKEWGNNIKAVLDGGKKADSQLNAEEYFRECFELNESMMGRKHEKTIAALRNLAMWLVEEQQWEPAESALSDLLTRCEQVHGASHESTLQVTSARKRTPARTPAVARADRLPLAHAACAPRGVRRRSARTRASTPASARPS